MAHCLKHPSASSVLDVVESTGNSCSNLCRFPRFQRRLEIANKNINTQQDTLDLTTGRAKAGLATELDVSRAAAQLETTKAAVPTLLSGIDVSIHRLSVLLGEEPGALRSELEKVSPVPTGGPDVEVGLPSDLLRRRPDIRRSEAQLAAATARIGEAEVFPIDSRVMLNARRIPEVRVAFALKTKALFRY